MAALNLDTYIELFKSKLVNGSDLLHLDRDKIGVRYKLNSNSNVNFFIIFFSFISQELGVKDDFHKDSILKAVEELLRTQNKTNLLPETKFDTSKSYGSKGADPSTRKLQHNLIKHSFSQIDICQICMECFYGLIHQGYICKNCHYKVHRTCSAVEDSLNNGIHRVPCTPVIPVGSTNSSTSDVEDQLPPPFAFANNTFAITGFSIFGLPLAEQFQVKKQQQKAPNIVELCCKEIERRCKNKPINSANMNVYQLYRSSATAGSLELRDRMIENLEKCRLADYSVQCIANVLKKFFRELPDPVIPFSMYQAFIDAASE
jgi:phosphoinositide-3-kinase regulatory subunit alpha/beta/delta